MYDNDLVKAVGKTVKGVKDECGTVTLNFTDDSSLILSLVGDCCSSSYFTDTKQFDELIGTKIYRVEDRYDRSEDTGDYTTTRWSFLVFSTDKGHVTIDWRNDSNGYYSGWLISTFMNAPNV